jgi:hypothetical protein
MSQDAQLYLVYFVFALFWLGAYGLIIYHGFRERTYGMPIPALIGNWPWEWIFGLGMFSACPLAWKGCPAGWMQAANFAAMFLDTFIVYTVVRYGRAKMTNPYIHRYFYWLIGAGLAASFLIQYTFITEVGFPNVDHVALGGTVPAYLPGDEAGTYSAYILTFLMGVLFIFTFWQREGLEGQSFLVALFMLLGNVFCYAFLLLLGHQTRFLATLFWLTVIVNVIYAAMTYRRTRQMGLNPWTRL